MIDIARFEQIVGEHSRPIYKYCCLRIPGDSTLAEEAVGDVFRILFEKWDSIESDESISAFLYSVADTCILRTRREMEKQERFRHIIQSYGETAANIREEDQPVWYDEYFADDRSEAGYVKEIRDSLPDCYRELFDMRHIRHMTISEISESTGIPYSTLRLRLQKLERMVRAEISRIFS